MSPIWVAKTVSIIQTHPLAVAADDRAAAFFDHDDGGRVPAFGTRRMICHENSQVSPGAARRVQGKGFVRFHLWTCREWRKGSDLEAIM